MSRVTSLINIKANR